MHNCHSVGCLHWSIGGKQSFYLIWSSFFFFFFLVCKSNGKKNLKNLIWGQVKHFIWLKINIFFTIKWDFPVFSFCEGNQNFSFLGQASILTLYTVRALGSLAWQELSEDSDKRNSSTPWSRNQTGETHINPSHPMNISLCSFSQYSFASKITFKSVREVHDRNKPNGACLWTAPHTSSV